MTVPINTTSLLQLQTCRQNKVLVRQQLMNIILICRCAPFLTAKMWKRDRKVDIVKDNLKEIAARMEMFPTDVSTVIINVRPIIACAYHE